MKSAYTYCFHLFLQFLNCSTGWFEVIQGAFKLSCIWHLSGNFQTFLHLTFVRKLSIFSSVFLLCKKLPYLADYQLAFYSLTVSCSIWPPMMQRFSLEERGVLAKLATTKRLGQKIFILKRNFTNPWIRDIVMKNNVVESRENVCLVFMKKNNDNNRKFFTTRDVYCNCVLM